MENPDLVSGARLDEVQAGRLAVSASEVCVQALAPFAERDWRTTRARDMEWSVWDTIVHVNDDLYFYAAQILLADEGGYICFELKADEHANPERLLAATAVQARLLAAVASSAEPSSRAHHVYGVSDPIGFACMGVVEVLIHTYDVLRGLDTASTWRPPDALAAPVLARLFPHVSPDVTADPGEVLLHVTGRIPLGDRPRLSSWRWDGTAPGQ